MATASPMTGSLMTQSSERVAKAGIARYQGNSANAESDVDEIKHEVLPEGDDPGMMLKTPSSLDVEFAVGA